MSLFPAYSEQINNEIVIDKDNVTVTNLEWLKNSSYQQISACLHSLDENEIWSDSSEEDVSVKKNENEIVCQNETIINNDSELLKAAGELKKKKKRKRIKTRLIHYETEVKNVYFEDKDRNTMFLKLDTLDSSMRPKYKISYRILGFNLYYKVRWRNFKRYHTFNLDAKKRVVKDTTIMRETVREKDEMMVDDVNRADVESEQQATTKEFNKKLTEHPKDIETWLEYVMFQDNVAEASQVLAEGSNLKAMTNEKKLSIVEKGLTVNPDSIELLKVKLHLMSELLPADQFSNRVEAMIQKDPKNIILWQALIMVIQTSCALCKVSKVLNSYVKCFPILKKKSKIDAKYYDQQVLGLLYLCLTFLRHAGLWEQMWEITRINLCLNLSLHPDTWQNVNTIDEKTLINMEEIILNSKLPLDQLWLRIESLRETCHWTGVDPKKVDVSLIGDDKRLVTAEETNDFIYPTISRDTNFRLVVLSILCLKVPLLPSRHCTLKDYKLEEHFWSIDSLEFILPMIYPFVWTGELDKRLANKSVIVNLLDGKLTSGPQFLKFHPAQESFIDFIRSVFHTVTEKLSPTQRTSILIWWLRFERLIVFVSSKDPLKEVNRNKKLKSTIKSFLKKPENRNNLHFYREYALIEKELGSFDSCVQILKTIIQSQNINCLESEEKDALFSLYRTIFDILLDPKTYKDSNLQIYKEIVESLKNYLSSCFNYDHNISVEEMLYSEILKFFNCTITEESEEAFLLPNVYCDILICYAYIVYNKDIRSDIYDIFNLFDRCLVHCNKHDRIQERLYETKMAFLQFCQQKSIKFKDIFSETINEALEKFPSNFFFLSINALTESELPYWKLKARNKITVWSIFATCLAGRARITYLKDIGLQDSSEAMINKMLALHKTVSKKQKVQGCPLVWRFYMLLLKEHNLCEKKGEEIYYEAVAQCPWARSVYISAAEIAPQILSQIQDLIKEKELRMHVTPEELEILRE